MTASRLVLKEGLYVVAGRDNTAWLRSVSTGTVARLTGADAEHAIQIAGGHPLRLPRGSVLAPHVERVSRVQPDAAVLARLRALGKEHAWRAPGMQGVTALERWRATQRLWADPWRNTAPLAACVVSHVTRVVRRGQRVGVLGFTETALCAAALGARVTLWTDEAAVVRRAGLSQKALDAFTPLHADAMDVTLVDIPGALGAAPLWLWRACAVTRAGGTIQATVHAPLRDHALQAAGRLPLRHLGTLRDHTAVLLPTLHQAPERLDVLTFKRVAGPVPADSPSSLVAPPGPPLADVHSHVSVRMRGATPALLEQTLLDALGSCGAASQQTVRRTTATHAHVAMALVGGGHLACVLELSSGNVALDLLPFHDGLATAFTHHLLARSDG